MNGITTDFITSGIKVLAQKSGENTIVWQIDGNGNTVGFNYNGTPYFYIKNAQGDIIAIADISGNPVAKYTYDSWGKLISIKDSNDVDKTTDENFIGYINPVRYRGYYYDSETGLYYLNARYYDPEVGRFINADETLSGGFNLFEYCLNNPILLSDLNGNDPGDRFPTVWSAYWDAVIYLQNQTFNDVDSHERATIIIKKQNPITHAYYYTYPDPVVGTNERSVNLIPLVRSYIHLSPDRLFLHTHGKYDSKFDNEHLSCYVNAQGIEVGDLPVSEKLKIQLGLVTPKGASWIYDGRSGMRGMPRELAPPDGIIIPHDPRYNGFLGLLNKLLD